MELLRKFDSVVVKLHYGACIGREIALKEKEKSAEMCEALVDCFNAALGPQEEDDDAPNLTIIEKVEYRDEDGWYRVLKDNEEDECRKWQARKHPQSKLDFARQNSEDAEGIQRWQMHRKLEASRLYEDTAQGESSKVYSREDSEDSSETSSSTSSAEDDIEPGQTSILNWLKAGVVD